MLPFPWAIAFLCVSVSLLIRDIITVILEEARHWNEALAFHTTTAASSSKMCSNAYCQRIKQAPPRLKTSQPLMGGQRGELGSQRISLSRWKFHKHQASWNRMLWDCHTLLTLFGQSNTFQLGTHCSKGQPTGLAATAAGIEGKAGFKFSGYTSSVIWEQVIKLIRPCFSHL